MNHVSLKIDIEKRSARLLMFYFAASSVVDKDSIAFFMSIGEIEDMVVSRDGDDFSVSMWYDYGSIISDSIWEMFDRNSLIGMCGDDVSEQLTRDAVLESVKQLHPKVAKAMEEGASKLIKGWKNKEV